MTGTPRKPGIVFLLPVCLLAAGTVLGLSRRGEPMWEPARVLWIPGGALLILYGVLVRNRVVRPHRPDASIDMVTLVAGAVGLAFMGVGLEHVHPAGPWTVFTLPAIIGGGLLCLRLARQGKRNRFVREMEEDRSPWLIRPGLWMFGLTWPLFALWAIGVVEFGD